MKQTLYKLDNKGKVREWTIEVDGGRYRVITGLVDGKKVESNWTQAEPKNVGRANATTAEEQALAEAKSLVQSKRDEFYYDNIATAMITEKEFEPMLAGKYEGWTGPVHAQPKLDGIRCNVSRRGAWSRGQKEFVTVQHIKDSLTTVLERCPIVFDGELYNHEYKEDFNTITSLVKKTKPTEEDLVRVHSKIEYHIYDCFDPVNPNATFKERLEYLDEIFTKYDLKHCVQVETRLAQTEDELDEHYAEWTGEGYEGQMVRIINSPYENKRSKFLLKRKPFHDLGGNEAEYQIVRIEQGKGNWAGKAKAIFCVDDRGEEFKATLKGNMAYAAQVWNEKDKYTGTLATVRYLNFTPRGVPRCGIAIDLDRGKY